MDHLILAEMLHSVPLQLVSDMHLVRVIVIILLIAEPIEASSTTNIPNINNNSFRLTTAMIVIILLVFLILMLFTITVIIICLCRCGKSSSTPSNVLTSFL